MVTSNDKELRRARALARALDSAFGIPGTPIRIGLDAILGLIPGGGDAAGAALSTYIVLAAARRGAPQSVLWRMLANIAVDMLIGAIPVLGDLFDVGYKANIRNVELLERYVAEPTTVARSSRGLGILIVTLIGLLLVGVAGVSVVVVRLLWNLLTTQANV